MMLRLLVCGVDLEISPPEATQTNSLCNSG